MAENDPLIAELRAADPWERTICYHEAGHFVACMVLGIPVEHVQMRFSFWGRALDGHVKLRNIGPDREADCKPGDDAVMTFAGFAAEVLYHRLYGGPEPDPEPSSSDTELGLAALGRCRGVSERQARSRAEHLVLVNWARVEALAATLCQRHKLSRAAAARAARV
jgi:hypothetical protein